MKEVVAMSDAMREEFEVGIKSINFPLTRKGEGYRSTYTDNMWLAYQHGRSDEQAAVQREWVLVAWMYSEKGGKPWPSNSSPNSFAPNELSENEVTYYPLYRDLQSHDCSRS